MSPTARGSVSSSVGVVPLSLVVLLSGLVFARNSAALTALRVELPASFGVALPRAWCDDCGGASYGSVSGLGVLFRPLDFVAAGVVIDRVSFQSREYDLLRSGGALRFYLPDQGPADRYLQFALGKTWAQVDGAGTNGGGYGPWVSLTAGLDLRVASWLKTGGSIGYHWSDDPAPTDVPFTSAGQGDGSASGRAGVVLLMGLRFSLDLGSLGSHKQESR